MINKIIIMAENANEAMAKSGIEMDNIRSCKQFGNSQEIVVNWIIEIF